jgi:predicted enzyme related to lactoylglutathione lyase
MKRVNSIGGIFFKCKDPDRMKDWYTKHLGLQTNDYSATFEWRQEADESKKGFTVWSLFNDETNYFAPSQKDFMINYRVENLENLVEELRKEGVTIVDTIETFSYGKFIHLLDPKGNIIDCQWFGKKEFILTY